ncbi:hypothetical protein SEA_HORUS_44 [Gordonia phage Horus]|uniref:Uncharacterized protein n=2 Tax=Caudoviricetes TaxID=2731619 RepID=A0A345L151_9CAUD|nr:hypothetical protein HOT72_gp043 [Gordonia phage Apricot]YP_009808282.1 hypothetical protein HOT93_gp044 [Gordonia phage Horus]QSL99792.1 hypothetical protein SEA_ODAY_48 [Gordonia phage ODay]QYC53711.1 hypothetical protein SEA_LEROY_44 [Gordonia phage Leroy]WNM69754.1 hypothetical protein SEA_CRATER_46 [Gordonia phage Crater]AXH49003.1 hypothetical protein SEA_APRICOT_43 [Gordonia phage Apricot]AXQ63897.1 hypothetical protein SEA_HORUS_44 [Gordonia phage Horus]
MSAYGPTDKGVIAYEMLQQGISLRHWHEVETGCSYESKETLCDECARLADEAEGHQ